MHRLKQKLRSSDTKDAAYTALGGLQRALDVFNDAAGDLGVPGLQKGVTGLSMVLALIQKSHGNTEDINDLAKKVRELTTMVKECAELHDSYPSPAMQARIDRLLSTWKTINDEATELKSRNRLIRIMNAEDEEEKIKGFVQRLSWSIQSFMVEGTVAIELALDEHARNSKQSAQRVEDKLGVVHEDILHLRMLSRPEGSGVPPYAISARFDCLSERTACLEGTRTDVLDRIRTWAVDAHADDSSSGCAHPNIFWLNGLVGSGKTTIAYTLAEQCQRQGILGASFFCSRSDSDCSNANMLITTIAYQLGFLHKPYKEHVTAVLQKDPMVAYSSVTRQFEVLIAEPLAQLREGFPPCVVVIDALDECSDPRLVSAILASLLRHADALAPLRILITSRPEPHILSVLGGSKGTMCGSLCLQDVASDVVAADIRRYLAAALADVARRFRLRDWPAEADVDALSRLMRGVFASAADAIRSIEDPNYNDPEGQLKAILATA